MRSVAVALVIAAVAFATPPQAPLDAVYGKSLISQGYFSPCGFIGDTGGRHAVADVITTLIEDVDWVKSPEDAVSWLAEKGEPLVGTFRSQCCWKLHNTVEPIDEHRAWSCAVKQAPKRCCILEAFYELTHCAGLGMPAGIDEQLTKSLTGHWAKALVGLGATGGDRSLASPLRSVGWLAKEAKIAPGTLMMTSMFACLSCPQNLANAVRFAGEKDFGPVSNAACVFGSFQDVLASSNSIPANAYGNYDLYQKHAVGTLRDMLADLKTTCWGINDLNELWMCGGALQLKYSLRFANSALS